MQINGNINLVNGGAALAAVSWKGGKGTFMAEASSGWGGGASVQLQIISPKGTAISIGGTALTANGSVNFELPPGLIQAVITGNPQSVFAYAIGLHQ